MAHSSITGRDPATRRQRGPRQERALSQAGVVSPLDQSHRQIWDPNPRECAATVLFADLRGYTTLAEHHAPRLVLGLLNTCFEVFVRCLDDEEAYLDKFLGDGLMAVFGLSNSSADHPFQALRAAVAMQQAFAGLADQLREAGWRAPGLGVGIDSGTMVAGSIGIPGNSQFTVIGDVVNVASRLTAGARPGEVVIGPGAGPALVQRVPLESLGVIPIRGRSSPVAAWRVPPDTLLSDCPI